MDYISQRGDLEIDGKIIDDHNRKSWQKSIGYVPQQIFLFDDTITSNIAFGLDQKILIKMLLKMQRR